MALHGIVVVLTNEQDGNDPYCEGPLLEIVLLVRVEGVACDARLDVAVADVVS